jgi:hypothetical protein
MLLFFHKGFTMIMKRKEQKLDGLWGEILTALVSIAASYGAVTAKVKNMERELETFRKDHDLLVRIDEKVSAIIDTQRKLEEQLKK